MVNDVSWILDGLNRPGRTRKGIAAALGLHEAAVTRLLKGRRNLRPQEIAPIAAYLGVAVPDIANSGNVELYPSRPAQNPASSRPGVLTPSGVVELGCFRERPPPSGLGEIAPDPRFGDHRQSAYESRGDGASAIGISDGMAVVAVDALDFREVHGPLGEGRPVILEVRAQLHGDALVEWSIRMPRVDGDVLHFDAPSPDAARTVSARRSEVERGLGAVRVLGVVVAAIRLF